MRTYIYTVMLFLLPFTSYAQQDCSTFKGYFYNEEYSVYLSIDFYEQNIEVPEHEMLGLLPGYMGKRKNNFYWLVTSGKIKNSNVAELSMINDYGSEDLEATLKKKNDSIFIFKQESGSPLKLASKGKWVKMPKTMIFKKKK